ncbi:MAG TPA: SRPBCC domain-containing protein [Candidatus Dormibacteraeota bacterium]|jgi:hypothetical protein|nr:SRPBCC domain-containing protein [Candidatus Dormibacteraeota bacterium]
MTTTAAATSKKQQDYRASIMANITPSEAFDRISRVSEWWTAGVTGSTHEIHDTFTLRWGKTFVDIKIAEVIPDKRVVWDVTDCNLDWISDKKEWKDTRITWDVSRDNDATRITMMHVGLVPEAECYKDCETGWNFYVAESLLKLMTEGTGLPDGQRR